MFILNIGNVENVSSGARWNIEIEVSPEWASIYMGGSILISSRTGGIRTYFESGLIGNCGCHGTLLHYFMTVSGVLLHYVMTVRGVLLHLRTHVIVQTSGHKERESLVHCEICLQVCKS